MQGDSSSFLIGIDGGGSACRAALSKGDGTRRHEVTLGAANVSTDFAGAVGVIRQALSQLCGLAGIEVAALAGARAHVGLAGVMNAEIAARVAAELPMRRLVVSDDRPTAVAGALGNGAGAVAAIGTGSFLARRSDGGLQLAGGWGYALGDQASGGWLGKRLLKEILLAVDGFAEWTDLARAIFDEFDCDPSAIVAFSLSARPGDFARLAPRLAVSSDPLAKALMQSGADYINRGLRAMGWNPGERICVMGGLGPSYLRYLPEEMQAASQDPKGSSLDGALQLAAQIDEAQNDEAQNDEAQP